jgi:hypothetical protein
MKKYGLIILLFLIGQFVCSQDLIVTQNDDSLNCKITKIDLDYIYFTFMYNNEIKKSLLPMTDIKIFQKKYYNETELTKPYLAYLNYSKFRIAFSGGFSYLLAKMPEGIDNTYRDYLKSFKKGYNLRLDIGYFFNRQYGIGLKYSYFNTKASASSLPFIDEQGNIVRLSLSENRSDNYIGPAFLMRYADALNKNAFIAGISFGYFAYNNNMRIGGIPLYAKGSTLGMIVDIGYDFSVSDNFSLGFLLSATLGSLGKITFNDGFQSQTIELPEDQHESMSRIDISIVLSFSK